MTRARRIAILAVVLVASAGFAPRSVVRGSSSLYSASLTSAPRQFGGATFSPSVAPVVSHTMVLSDQRLSWTPVTVSSGATVTYVVTRTRAGLSTVVCTGADAPVLTGGLMTCTDRRPGTGLVTYTEQPVVVRSGQTTWSLSPSVAN